MLYCTFISWCYISLSEAYSTCVISMKISIKPYLWTNIFLFSIGFVWSVIFKESWKMVKFRIQIPRKVYKNYSLNFTMSFPRVLESMFKNQNWFTKCTTQIFWPILRLRWKIKYLPKKYRRHDFYVNLMWFLNSLGQKTFLGQFSSP